MSKSGWGNGHRVWDVGAISWADISTHDILKGIIAGRAWKTWWKKNTKEKEEMGHRLVQCTSSGRSRRLLCDPRFHSHCHSAVISPSRRVSSTTSWTSVTTCCKVWRLKLTANPTKYSKTPKQDSFLHTFYWTSVGLSPHWSLYINNNKWFHLIGNCNGGGMWHVHRTASPFFHQSELLVCCLTLCVWTDIISVC